MAGTSPPENWWSWIPNRHVFWRRNEFIYTTKFLKRCFNNLKHLTSQNLISGVLIDAHTRHHTPTPTHPLTHPRVMGRSSLEPIHVTSLYFLSHLSVILDRRNYIHAQVLWDGVFLRKLDPKTLCDTMCDRSQDTMWHYVWSHQNSIPRHYVTLCVIHPSVLGSVTMSQVTWSQVPRG